MSPTPHETTIGPQALREFYAEFGEMSLVVRELRVQLAASRIETSTLRVENTELKAKYEPAGKTKGAVPKITEANQI